MEIKRNDEVDIKLLQLPEYMPTYAGDLAVKWGPTPTPAKKWIIERRHYDLFLGTHDGCHGPPQRTRRMTWVKWLWGNEQWEGCGAPWDHNVVRCPLWNN